jgi:hypothetical protein
MEKMNGNDENNITSTYFLVTYDWYEPILRLHKGKNIEFNVLERIAGVSPLGTSPCSFFNNNGNKTHTKGKSTQIMLFILHQE